MHILLHMTDNLELQVRHPFKQFAVRLQDRTHGPLRLCTLERSLSVQLSVGSLVKKASLIIVLGN